MAHVTAIIALDDTEEADHEFYLVSGGGDSFYLVIKRAKALLKNARVAHATFLSALVTYNTKIKGATPSMTEKKNLEESQDIIASFMGEECDLDELGEWEKVTQDEFNNRLAEDGCYCFVKNIDWSNTDKYY